MIYDNLVVAFAKSCAVSFFHRVKARRHGTETKADMKSPGFGDTRGNSPQLDAAWFGHDNPIFLASLTLTFFTQFFWKKNLTTGQYWL